MAETTAVVVISGSHSYCSRCGQNVVSVGPNKKRHIDKAGWQAEDNKGCGSLFIARTTDRLGEGEEFGGHLWPRLPFVPLNEVYFTNKESK